MVSLTQEIVLTGERTDVFGNSPNGFLTYEQDGRMMLIVTKANRPKPADLAKLTDEERVDLFKSMIAYGGTFNVDGTRVMHKVDISWNETTTGSTQVRNFRIEGRRLILTSDPQVGFEGKKVIYVATWERI